MRVIIAGGRDFNDYKLLKEKCDLIFANNKPVEIISGRCFAPKTGVCTFTTYEGINVYGADGLGEKWAELNNVPVKPFPYLKQYGKAGGPIRNRQMAEYATNLIAFWDGKSRGTKNMIDTAKEFNLPTRIILY